MTDVVSRATTVGATGVVVAGAGVAGDAGGVVGAAVTGAGVAVGEAGAAFAGGGVAGAGALADEEQPVARAIASSAAAARIRMFETMEPPILGAVLADGKARRATSR
jgi:hypothetical protein